MSIKCKNCGFENLDDSSFCAECGGKLQYENVKSNNKINSGISKLSKKINFATNTNTSKNNIEEPNFDSPIKYSGLKYVAWLYKILTMLIAVAGILISIQLSDMGINKEIIWIVMFIVASICFVVYSNVDRIKLQIEQTEKLKECSYYLKIIANNLENMDFKHNETQIKN